jgi:biotin synthase
VYPLVGVEELVRRAEAAQAMRARRFCIVTSGRGVVQDEDMEVICEAIRQITTLGLLADASLGELTGVQVARLKEAGLSRYNHNIETAPSFFPSVCSTHTFTDRLQSIRLIKEAEIQLCCGGILDLGESPRQRLEMAFTLQSIDPDCIPINFLHPIRGTPVYKNTLSPPGELLKFLAILRFILPAKQIKVCGGREARLRSLQPLLFLSGADSFLIGDYLTTQGNPAAKDLEMIEDLGLVVVDR